MAQTKNIKKFLSLLEGSLSLEPSRAKKNSVEAINSAAAELGLQGAFKIAHVAGSKGKGSVSHLLARILAESGKTCGLFTSPHISSLFERVLQGDGKFFDERLYECGAARLFSLGEKKLAEFSWFELILLFALATFKAAGCEWVVLETGMGGRLDATNFCQSEFSVVTSIELEHCQFLGGTIAQIAFEKAGIIKARQQVFCGILPKEAKRQIKKTADEKKSNALFLDENVQIRGIKYLNDRMQTEFSFENDGKTEKFCINSHLLGQKQAENIALCAFIAQKALKIPAKTVKKAIESVEIPARFEQKTVEFANSRLNVIYDGAHTKESLLDFCKTLENLEIKNAALLFSCAKDKNPEVFAKIFEKSDFFQGVFVTPPGKFKKCDLVAIKKFFSAMCAKKCVGFFCDENCEKTIAAAANFALRRNCALVVTGSFYLIDEAKKLLERKSDDFSPFAKR